MLPESILFYRQLLQWMGGMGLIVLAIAVMPLLGIGGGQIYRTEVPEQWVSKKTNTKDKRNCASFVVDISWSYFLCGIFYYIGGMSVFDAVSHAMSTVAIGGFSPHDASIGYFNSAFIEFICILFMILSL